MRRVVVALTVAIMSSTAAQAHWQFTTWGMSPADVVAASAGKVRLASGIPTEVEVGVQLGARGQHTIGSTTVPATFYFSNGGLQLVKLTFEGDPGCYAIDQRLSAEYGFPFAVESNVILTRKTWKDQKRGNRLEYLRIGDSCWLKYRSVDVPPASEL